MNLTVYVPKALERTLEQRAHEANLSPARYVQHLLENLGIQNTVDTAVGLRVTLEYRNAHMAQDRKMPIWHGSFIEEVWIVVMDDRFSPTDTIGPDAGFFQ